MDAEETRKGDRCGINNCRSRQYILEDGQWYCGNGHVQEGQLDTQVEEDYHFKGDRRALPSEDGTEVEKTIVLTGKKGIVLYLQAYQLVLRHQLHYLIHERHFPAELELIVRDLWSLRLPSVIQPSVEDDQGSQSSGWSTSDDTDSASVVSASQSSQRSSSRKRKRRRRQKKYDPPSLLTSVCLCYIAMALLRLPISIGDVHSWIVSRELLYVRAVTVIPVEMLVRMEGAKKRIFSPTVLPAVGSLQGAIYHVMIFYHGRFSITVPPLNHTLLLDRYLHELGLPLEIYPAVKRMIKKLSLNFEFQLTSIKFKMHTFPEIKLMALIIITAKLCYGFDGTERHAKTKTEVANLEPPWEMWKSMLERKAGVEQPSIAGREMEVDERDIYKMDGKTLDNYMDWYEKVWYSDDKGGASRQILSLFKEVEERTQPNAASEENDVHLIVRTLNQNLNLKPSLKDGGERVLPGERYMIYPSSAELPEKLKLLMDAAAVMVGVPTHDLARAVYHLENHMKNVLRKEEVNLQEGNAEEPKDASLEPQ